MKKKFEDFCKENKKYVRWFLIILIIMSTYTLLRLAMGAYLGSISVDDMEEVTYNEFLQMAKKGEVDTVYYRVDEEYMHFTLFNKDTLKMSKEKRKEYNYKLSDYRKALYPAYEEFRRDMLEQNVNMELFNSKTDIVNIISGGLTLAFPVLLIVMLFKSVSGIGGGNVKESDIIKTSDVRFENIIGHDEVLEDIKFVVELLKNPDRGTDIGAKPPKGILLSGHPGTGKTLIAKAIAGEAGVPFLQFNASGFNEVFVGVGAKRVRELFKTARNNAPCVVFIDEIDAVGGQRSVAGTGSSEADNTVNALLTEMDGFDTKTGVFVIAATNRADKLDSALVRAGRFDRQVIVNPPKDWRVRKKLFEHYLKDLKVSDDVDIDSVSKQVVGFTGADIAAVCNEAGVIALMHGLESVNNSCILEAVDKKIFKGNKSKQEHFKKDKEIVAYHEASHAVMTMLLGHPIARASISATTSGVGGVVFGEETNSTFMTDKEFREDILIAYAGRAGEEIKFSCVTTGASNDITQATQRIVDYIEKFGFDEDFGLLDMSVLTKNAVVTANDSAQRVSKMSKELYRECIEKLRENFDMVEKLATELLSREAMTGREIEKLFSEE